MEEKTTMEITNDRLEEAIKDYAADRTKEKLTAVLNLLRPTKLLVPAMLKAPDQPTPCFLKSGAGEQYFVVYTSKEQMANAPKSQALLSMPFPACNSVAVKPELNLSGMVINPFTDNLVLKIELIQKLHEADEKMAKQPKQIKMTPQQFQAFVKNQTEFSVIPKRNSCKNSVMRKRHSSMSFLRQHSKSQNFIHIQRMIIPLWHWIFQRI